MRLNRNLPFFIVLDNIRSLENIGSIFRTADALAVTKIYLTGISGRPPHHKIAKTALGAEVTVPWAYFRQAWRLLDGFKADGIKIVCLEQAENAIDISKFKPTFPLALIVGNEIEGISASLLKRANAIVQIPMLGEKESLNVSVAFGIAGFEINRFRLK